MIKIKKQDEFARFLNKKVEVFTIAGKTYKGKFVNYNNWNVEVEEMINKGDIISKTHKIDRDLVKKVVLTDGKLRL